jgi:hypothetical protein
MVERVLVDNDIVLKTASYSLSDALLSSTTLESVPPAILGVAKWVVRGRIERARGFNDRERAKAALDEFLERAAQLEPTDTELEVAAELEASARNHDLELDGGESQLLAILLNRRCDLLLTGDKRAISAIAVIGPPDAHGRLGCLEQFVMDALRSIPLEDLRKSICAEPQADRAMAICFACSRAEPLTDNEPHEGLKSYISHLWKTAPNVLLRSYDLSALRNQE